MQFRRRVKHRSETSRGPHPDRRLPSDRGVGATQPCRHLVSNTGAEHATYWPDGPPTMASKPSRTSAEKSKKLHMSAATRQRRRVLGLSRYSACLYSHKSGCRPSSDAAHTILRLRGTGDLVEPKEVPDCDTAQASCTWLYRARY